MQKVVNHAKYTYSSIFKLFICLQVESEIFCLHGKLLSTSIETLEQSKFWSCSRGSPWESYVGFFHGLTRMIDVDGVFCILFWFCTSSSFSLGWWLWSLIHSLSSFVQTNPLINLALQDICKQFNHTIKLKIIVRVLIMQVQ